MRFFFSAQPFLATCLARHFYQGVHHVYVAPFYPYRLPNPKSSNPLEIFRDLYHAWYDRDDYDKFVAQMRLNLRKGVIANRGNTIDADTADRLFEICDRVDIKFFRPMFYKVDIDSIAEHRLLQAGSAARGSIEYLIPDLHEEEFELLFYDDSLDEDIQRLWDLPQGSYYPAMELLTIYVRARAI